MRFAPQATDLLLLLTKALSQSQQSDGLSLTPGQGHLGLPLFSKFLGGLFLFGFLGFCRLHSLHRSSSWWRGSSSSSSRGFLSSRLLGLSGQSAGEREDRQRSPGRNQSALNCKKKKKKNPESF